MLGNLFTRSPVEAALVFGQNLPARQGVIVSARLSQCPGGARTVEGAAKPTATAGTKAHEYLR